MKPPVVALYDANVLFPAPLRDLLLRLAETGLVRPRWTDAIHDEWVRSVLRFNPALSAERLSRTRAMMNAAFVDCLVVGFESSIESIQLPDPDDRHVLAAAVHANCDVIVTCNLSDFPEQALKPHGISAWHPDAFVATLFAADRQSVIAAVARQRADLRQPPKTADDLLDGFARLGLVKTVEMLRPFSDSL